MFEDFSSVSLSPGLLQSYVESFYRVSYLFPFDRLFFVCFSSLDLSSNIVTCSSELFDIHDCSAVQVPASRGDVFASSVVSLKQKRQLMKFLKSCNDFNESGDLAVVGIEDENESFSSFLERSGLDSTLLRLILYPIALLFDDPNGL